MEYLNSGLNVIVGYGGIARALVSQLLQSGEKVLVLARNLIDNSAAGYKHIELANEASIAEAFAEIHEPLSKVIVCTGLLHANSEWGPERQWSELNSEILLKYFQINTIGPALVAKHAFAKFPKDHRSIFCSFSARVSSVSDNALGGWYGYRASKSALNMIIKNLAIEARRKRPKCVVIGYHPGTVDTPLSKPFQRNVKPEKLFTPEFAAEACLRVINNLSMDDSGNLLDWQGLTIEP